MFERESDIERVKERCTERKRVGGGERGRETQRESE